MEITNENEIEPELETEGTINNIPTSINISNKFISDYSEFSKHFRQNSFTFRNSNKSISTVLSAKDFKNNDIFNSTARLDKSKFRSKCEDCYSTATKSSLNDKLKKVTFSTVEIIRVKNYKRYNRMNSIKKNENDKEYLDEDKCLLF